jgi:hypothetical protein
VTTLNILLILGYQNKFFINFVFLLEPKNIPSPIDLESSFGFEINS